MLDEMHKQKIDMSYEIYVINVGGYIGESTKSEIELQLIIVIANENKNEYKIGDIKNSISFLFNLHSFIRNNK